jgi:pyrroloquinoline quinone (PQQ) biosynthesis protein C
MRTAEREQPRTALAAGEALAARLDEKLAEILEQVAQSEFYRIVADPATDPQFAFAIVKYIILEIFHCEAHVVEATFTAIGRLPKDRPDWMKPMMLHALAEVPHGEMALRDFIRLGGDERWARSRRMTPASFAMAAICRRLAEHENPISYLGYMYLVEGLTPELAARGKELLRAKGFPAAAQQYLDVHAVVDIEHTATLRKLIVRIASEYPDAASAIEYGFDCLRVAYPLQIWNAALENARAEWMP